MATEFRLPELGENITAGDVVNVLVQEGQTIAVNQGVVELETDKAVIEIPCPLAGRVTKVHVAKGKRVSVGEALVTVEAGAGAVAEPAPKPAPAKTAPHAPATSTPPAPARPAEAAKPQAVAPAASAGPAADDALLPAGPAARRVARELGVDLRSVAGSGPRGRITPEDVQAAASTPAGPAVPPSPAVRPATPRGPVVPPGEPGSDAYGPITRERISQIRRIIATRMAQSSSTIPHVTNFDDADVTDLERVRKTVPEGALGPGLKLTMLPLAMRAVAMALVNHPAVNATIDSEKDEIVYKRYVNLGVAVDTPRGLVVPVIRNAHGLSVAQLAAAVGNIATRARAAKFAVEELRGGTFTMSNLGAVGGTYSTPIINAPEVAILLLGRSRWLPVVREGRIEPRYMMPLSLSYDHRLVDGATAARFLNEVIENLQSPGKLLLG